MLHTSRRWQSLRAAVRRTSTGLGRRIGRRSCASRVDATSATASAHESAHAACALRSGVGVALVRHARAPSDQRHGPRSGRASFQLGMFGCAVGGSNAAANMAFRSNPTPGKFWPLAHTEKPVPARAVF